MKTSTKEIFILLLILLITFAVKGQDSLADKGTLKDSLASYLKDSLFAKPKLSLFPSLSFKDSIRLSARWNYSIKSFFNDSSILKFDYSCYDIDSSAKKQLASWLTYHPAYPKLEKPDISNPLMRYKNKQLLSIGGGYITYNYNFRSSVDTPFVEKDISQHIITGAVNFKVAETIPLRLTYFGRESNSEFFRDIRRARLEFNAAGFQNTREEKLRKYFNSQLDQLEDPLNLNLWKVVEAKGNGLLDWLNQSSVVSKYIRSKETIINGRSGNLFGAAKDSTLMMAKEYVSFYEELGRLQEKYESLSDSLKQLYHEKESKIKQLRDLIEGKINTSDKLRQLKEAMMAAGLEDKRFGRLIRAAYSVRTLSLGNAPVNRSELTLKNININGINFEYSNGIYLAMTAGAIDFRSKDFVLGKQKQTPQVVYSASAGYGARETNYFILTYYSGKKQLINQVTGAKSTPVSGLSASMQLSDRNYNRVNAEISQSVSPLLINGNSTAKTSFDFSNKNNRAYSFQLHSTVPLINTRLEGMYQHRGANYQDFTSYRMNAQTNSWSVKAEQWLWRRQLQLVAAARKNDFANPYILQRYDAGTVFKTFSVAFRKRRWPSLTIAYNPSSQYSIVDSTVYENHYQILNASGIHQYKLGSCMASTAITYSRFYNNASDTGFIYYNASNYFCTQTFRFNQYTTNIGISHVMNGEYKLNVMEMGIALGIRDYIIGGGIKINMLNHDRAMTGFYANARMTLWKLGELVVSLDQSYLPDSHQKLSKYQFHSIGFTRYFK